MGEPRPGRTVVITGDTAPCRATVEAARGAELLVHDASFAEEEVQRAADTGHSTVGQAAAVAREAGVGMLALVHISSRYHVGRCWRRRARSSSRRSRRATSTWSRSPSRSGANRPWCRTARASARHCRSRGTEALRRLRASDRLGNAGRLVFLEEVLGGQQRRVLDPERPHYRPPALCPEHPVLARPRRPGPGRAGPASPSRKKRSFSGVSSKPRMIRGRRARRRRASSSAWWASTSAADTADPIRDANQGVNLRGRESSAGSAARARQSRGSRTGASATGDGSWRRRPGC